VATAPLHSPSTLLSDQSPRIAASIRAQHPTSTELIGQILDRECRSVCDMMSTLSESVRVR